MHTFAAMKNPVDILAFGAHPDDVELGCGATIAKQVNLGNTVAIVDLTRGELGTRGNAELRDKEALTAANVLGVQYRENLGLADGFFQIDEQSLRAVAGKIRKYRPRIILCNAIHDRHPDHPKGSSLVSQAVFLAGLKKVELEDEMGEILEPHRPQVVYHYQQFYDIRPDVLVDVSSFIEKKIEAVQAFSSQFYNPESDEPETLISSKAFLESLRHRASELGRIAFVSYAEGFNVERYPVVDSLFHLK
jgi:N-acetylglucosamine malate deacetylase 1